MSSARYLFMVLIVLALGAPKPVWSANESAGLAEENIATREGAPSEGAEAEGHGQGFEPEAQAPKEECPATFGPILTDTAIPMEKGKFAIQPTFGLSFVTNNFTSSWQRVSAGGDFKSFGMSWRLTYGLINNLEVYTVIPYIHNWARNVDVPGLGEELSANSGGLGDISLTFKYRLVEETEVLPTVSAIFTPTFPSGKFRNLNPALLGTDLVGGGSYVFTPGLNLSKYVKPFMFYGNFWYSMPTAVTVDEGRLYPRDFVTVNLAAEYPFTSKWVACLELTSYWDTGRLFGRQSNVPSAALLSLTPEIEYMATDKFSLSLGVSFDVVGKNTTANITPLLSMIYAF